MVRAWDWVVVWPGAFAGGGRGDDADTNTISGVVCPFSMQDRVSAAKVVKLDCVGATSASG